MWRLPVVGTKVGLKGSDETVTVGGFYTRGLERHVIIIFDSGVKRGVPLAQLTELGAEIQGPGWAAPQWAK